MLLKVFEAGEPTEPLYFWFLMAESEPKEPSRCPLLKLAADIRSGPAGIEACLNCDLPVCLEDE